LKVLGDLVEGKTPAAVVSSYQQQLSSRH